ncbi:MAG: hypothetical protein WCJ01_04725 [Ignavibacteria bacterium]
MEIIANKVGNYGPGYANQVKPKAKPEEKFSIQNVNAQEINTDEKKYSMNTGKKNEIVDYHYYQKSGKMSGVSIGSLFDKRG